jgi:PleD family two-component response regulator
MNYKASVPIRSQASWLPADEAISWMLPRRVSRPEDARSKTPILVIDDHFREVPGLFGLLQEDGFSVDIKSHTNFTLVADGMLEDYQAVIVDVMIPHSSGFDLLRDICKHTHLPLLVLPLDKYRGSASVKVLKQTPICTLQDRPWGWTYHSN